MKNSQVNTPEGREWLLVLLRERPVSITFLKKDGTERSMLCTLSESEIPKEKMPKGVERNKSEEALPVFDLDKQEWRSFRWDSVKTIEFNLK